VSETIRAKEFIVVDEQGRDRAKFGATEAGVSLEMANSGDARLSLSVSDSGHARLEIHSGTRMIRLLIDDHRATVKLKNDEQPASSCGLRLDGCGAWVYAEAAPDIGFRVLSNHEGRAASLWMSEKCSHRGESSVRTRYVRPNPSDDKLGAWTCDD